MKKRDNANSLVEEREEEMVALNGSQQPIKRKGFFLEPTSKNSSHEPSLTPKHNNNKNGIFSLEPKYKSDFSWWADPQQDWVRWVEMLMPKFSHIWKKAGIFDAIMASGLKYRRDPLTLLGVSSFWSKESNTFIFPWGEATVTLEDVMILGNFSALGEPVRIKEPLGGVLGHMVSKMTDEMSVCRRKCKKANHSNWIKHCMEACKDEIEHIGFLSLWLSRFVLIAGNERYVSESVLQVAVRLAVGMKIALAPAVLASIYHNLGVVKDYVCKKSSSSILVVRAPFNIVQFWLWERFSALRPDAYGFCYNRSRSTRWSFSGKPLDLSSVMKVLKSPDEFEWRPYAIELEKWCMPSFYMNRGGWFYSDSMQDEELRSFSRCLKVCELVGMDCIEMYQPHRVAMQFGLDQDLPSFISRVDSTWEDAWRNYENSLTNVDFYLSPRVYKSEVTLEYYNWWKNIPRKEMLVRKKRKKAKSFANRRKKKVKGMNGDRCKIISCDSQERDDVAINLDSGVEGNKEGIEEVAEKRNGKVHMEVENEIQLEEDSQQKLLDDDGGGITMECSIKANTGEIHRDGTVIKISAANQETRETEDIDPMKKELERDIKIRQLKEEIAVIVAEITCLESLQEARLKAGLIRSPS